MTESEAKYLAQRKAEELNMPWGIDVKAKLMRIWPLPGVWRVVSRVPKEFSETTIDVDVRTGKAIPKRVRVSKKFGVGGEGTA